MDRLRPWWSSWRMGVALVWVVGASVTTFSLNAHYADPALAALAARQRAVILNVDGQDSADRTAELRNAVTASVDGAVGPNTQYLFDRLAERQHYAIADPLHAWDWNVLLTLFTAAAVPFIFSMGWLGRRIAR